MAEYPKNCGQGQDLKVDGNVGIGTVEPAAKLEISSPKVSSKVLSLKAADGSGLADIWEMSGSGGSQLVLRDEKGDQRVSLQGSGDSCFDAGNVGIGTPSPQRRLEVNGDLRIYNQKDDTATLLLEQEAGGTGYISHHKSGVLTIGAKSEGRITIDDAGNVGIGTPSPQRRLEVNGDLRIYNQKDDMATLLLEQEDGGTGYISHHKSGILTIGAKSEGRITIDGAGNVGIGRDAPNEKLEVAGIIYSTQGFKFPDGRIQKTAATSGWVNAADYGMKPSNDSKDAAGNLEALEKAKDALPIDGGTVFIPSGKYSMASLEWDVDNTRLLGDNGSILDFNDNGAGTAVRITVSNVTIENLRLDGPLYQNGIEMVPSSSEALSGLVVRNCEITGFRTFGIYCQYVDDITIEHCNIHDCGYSGATFLTCNNGRFLHNVIRNISPGNKDGEMYGISLSHDSTDYNTITHGKDHPNAFCRGWLVLGNEISGVKTWEGIDCHGGYEVQIIGNKVYATKKGISMPSSSGAATDYAGATNIVAYNIVDARNSDGTPSGCENEDYGINLNGGSMASHERIICTGNILIHKGIASNRYSGAIQAERVQNGIISNNIFVNWGGGGIILAFSQVSVTSNLFSDTSGPGDTMARCIHIQAGASNDDARYYIIGNVAMPSNNDRTARYGVYVHNSAEHSHLFTDANDFSKTSETHNGIGDWRTGPWGR